MLASILKLASWLGLSPNRGAVPLPEAPKPSLKPTAQPKAGRRSGRRTSPLATRRERRTGRPQLIVLAALKPPVSKAGRRPKSVPPAPKRTPHPRHVWLESRLPAATRSPAATVIALPSGRKRSDNLALRVLAAA